MIDTEIPTAGDVDLLESSDSGMSSLDNVTSINQPAFAGVGSVGDAVRIEANGNIVGTGFIGSDDSDGVPGDGLGAWEITVEPLDDDEYEIVAVVENLAGSSFRTDPLTIWVDTTAPNLPLLDLVSDTGFSDHDGITSDNTPDVTVTANDTPGGGLNPFPNDIKYRIYDRTGDEAEVLLINSFDMIGFSIDGFFENTLPELADGIHNLKLEVEDRAGNISHEFLLEILVDTELPISSDVDLLESSDSGMSSIDDVTGINQPAFAGIGSVGDAVRIEANGNIVGTGIIGSDASDGMPGDGLGAWEITVEPLDDDEYEIVAVVENLAGGEFRTDPLTVWVDTTAPNLPPSQAGF